jgi:hypothetical protein
MDGEKIYRIIVGIVGVEYLIYAFVSVRKDIRQYGWKLTMIREQKKK